MRVVELISSTLRLEQGSLTGESEAVVAEDPDIQGKKCIVFAGTTVVNGHCFCLVTQTDMETKIGKVHNQTGMETETETGMNDIKLHFL